MKTIEVDEDVYDYILHSAQFLEETGSSILRRLLNIKPRDEKTGAVHDETRTDIETHLASTNFRYTRGVVGKFLSVLGFIYGRHPKDFGNVENIKGRGRLYFARDKDTLNQAGQSVNPKQIPGSPYWVISTTPTILKQEILEKVMKMFNYSSSEIRKVVLAVAE